VHGSISTIYIIMSSATSRQSSNEGTNHLSALSLS